MIVGIAFLFAISNFFVLTPVVQAGSDFIENDANITVHDLARGDVWYRNEEKVVVWNKKAFDNRQVDLILCKKGFNCWPIALEIRNDGKQVVRMPSDKLEGEGYYVVVRYPRSPNTAQNSDTFAVQSHSRPSQFSNNYMMASVVSAVDALVLSFENFLIDLGL